MANLEHLAILNKGVTAWNKWREEHPYVRPDLSGAHLSGADLSRANLQLAKLGGANLGGANLSGANLIGAELRGANLSEADLAWADLTGANLSGANLSLANLALADLYAADVSRAHFAFTVLGDNDLSRTKGLDTVEHSAPSTIGIDTIQQSGGKIPEVFLRGAGVPDTWIKYIGSLVGQPVQFYSCFISYSTKDQEFADRLHADLQAKGVRCWFAPHDLKIGDRFRQRIHESIRDYDKLMVVLSANSIYSEWVEKEVETAFEKERKQKTTVLFPIRLDDEVMNTNQAWAADIRTRHIGDFTKWKDHGSYKEAFDRLLRDLKAEGAAAAPAP
jgi:uncharacterized protein YjbI with pentapeptide repeats